eukprot:6206981-Pleurochrysis_carterae.AAC.4
MLSRRSSNICRDETEIHVSVDTRERARAGVKARAHARAACMLSAHSRARACMLMRRRPDAPLDRRFGVRAVHTRLCGRACETLPSRSCQHARTRAARTCTARPHTRMHAKA